MQLRFLQLRFLRLLVGILRRGEAAQNGVDLLRRRGELGRGIGEERPGTDDQVPPCRRILGSTRLCEQILALERDQSCDFDRGIGGQRRIGTRFQELIERRPRLLK